MGSREPGCAPRSLSSPHISPKRQPPLSRDPTYRCRAAFPVSPLTHNPGNLAPASAATPQAPATRAAHGQGSSRNKQFLGKREQNTFTLGLGTGTQQLCIQTAWRVGLLILKHILFQAVSPGGAQTRSTVPHGEHRWGIWEPGERMDHPEPSSNASSRASSRMAGQPGQLSVHLPGLQNTPHHNAVGPAAWLRDHTDLPQTTEPPQLTTDKQR